MLSNGYVDNYSDKNIDNLMEAVVRRLEEHIKYNSMVCVEDFIKDNFNIERFDMNEIINEFKEGKCKAVKNPFKCHEVKNKSYIANSTIEIKEISTVESLVSYIGNVPLTVKVIEENEKAKQCQKISKRQKKEQMTITFADVAEKAEEMFYRGHANVNFELIPSLFREKIWEENESKMYHNLISRFPEKFDNKKRHLDILQEMQHYSLPTRLLDVTQNPLVALYFAISESAESDGEVIIFHANKEILKNAYSDSVELLCALAALPNEIQRKLFHDVESFKNLNNDKSVIKEFSGKESVNKLLQQSRQKVGNFEPVINPKDLKGMRFVTPQLSNARIIRQNGSFIVAGLFGNGEDRKFSLIKEYDKHRVKYGTGQIRYIIPSICKEKILNQLNMLGINESTIYPEIDHVANYIKNNIKYTHNEM